MNKSKNTIVCLLSCGFLILAPVAMADQDSKTYQKTQIEINDSVIVSKIKKLYSSDEKLAALGIEVMSSKGDVILKGKVDTDEEYVRAVSLALSIDGVEEVNTKDLSIKHGHNAIEDTYITGVIKGLLIKEKVLNFEGSNAHKVSVTTKDGVVYLSGKLNSEEEKDAIVEIASSLDGVKSVKSDKLKVK